MSELNYTEIANDWVLAKERTMQAQSVAKAAQVKLDAAYAEQKELEVKLHKSVKDSDNPPIRLFVVGYSYENKGVIVSRFNGYTLVHTVTIEEQS